MHFIIDEERRNGQSPQNESGAVKDKQTEKTDKTAQRKKKLQKKTKSFEYKWIIIVFIASFFITAVLSFLSNGLLDDINIIAAVLVLVFFILIGMIFDMVGIAIATADEKQFHSMAARKIQSAKYAIKLIRHAEKVSSFCNDVVGDIAGIMSGATGTAIAAVLFITERSNILGTILITSVVAAVTVGSKAFGKSLGMSNSNDIVNVVSKIICFFARFRVKLNKKK